MASGLAETLQQLSGSCRRARRTCGHEDEHEDGDGEAASVECSEGEEAGGAQAPRSPGSGALLGASQGTHAPFVMFMRPVPWHSYAHRVKGLEKKDLGCPGTRKRPYELQPAQHAGWTKE